MKESKEAAGIFATVLKSAQPINPKQPEGRVILKMILEMIIAFDATASGIMIGYGTPFKNGQGVHLLIDGEWTRIEEEPFRDFVLSYADLSGITLTETYSLAYTCLWRNSPPQLCKNWTSMVQSARLTLKKYSKMNSPG